MSKPPNFKVRFPPFRPFDPFVRSHGDLTFQISRRFSSLLVTVIVMFMITSSTTLSAVAVTALTLMIVVDRDGRLRLERVDSEKALIWKARDRFVRGVTASVRDVFGKVFRRKGAGNECKDSDVVVVRYGERQRLLG